ncbi:type IV pilus secretin PilQ [Ramlibacter sp. H39-3-26]|nr:type IV pilus secretin PilQ [Ramlibacter sp. H39-3-26]MDF1483764.1 type IV pilus secretin PilQ [Ramlibacter sp. H39-3-26]
MLALAAFLSCQMAYAQLTIESVSGLMQAGSDVLRIDLNQPPSALPSGFAIQSPARIALDFPATGNSTGRNSFDISQGNIKSANVVQAGDRTRIVLNLKQATSYKAEIKGNSVYVILEPVAGPAAVASSGATVFAEGKNTDVLPIKDIDFRRSADGSGRVIVSLPNNQVGVDLRQQGKGLVVEFLRSSLPEGLRRRIDVADFGTPVRAVASTQAGDRVRMTIEPVGDWEHSAYQSDNQFVVEVRQKKVDLSRLTQGPGYSGEKLSLNFQNIDVRSLLQVIADFTNFNIITSDSVNGALTLRLKDVPWDQALQIIMDAKGLGMKKTGTVLWIAPKDEIDARTKKDYEAAIAIEKLEPLRTQSFQLNYAKAGDMIKQLNGTGTGQSGGSSGTNARFLSDRGTVIAEPRTNQLFVSDTATKLEEIRQLLAKLDVPVRQVLIEARIVEASDTFGRSLGVRLGGTDLRAQNGGDAGYRVSGNNRIAFGTSYSNAIATSGAGGTVNTAGSFVNLPAVSQGGADPASFAVSIFNSAANRFLNLEISALEADGKGRIVSSPRVITADQTKALIEQGTEFPYQQATSSGATSIAFRKANLKLEVTPQITPEGNIILDLDINKDSKGEETTQGVAINTKHIQTQVLVENGGTVVIGGIFELTESENENKVPLLGDIPAVGNLFKSRSRSSNKQEMLVFITPKMIAERSAAR